MKQINPKSHDSLFKWLISSFTKEFFAHYFPDVKIGEYSFIDKEFISKYEALKESLKGDLFLLMEIEVNGNIQEVAIQIEHQSTKEEVAARLFEYLCYVWLLKKRPVWSIVVYTDDAIWRKSVETRFYYGSSTEHPEQYFHFDVIKINREKSGDLIKKHSLLCKLLALKANDQGADPEELIREIYQATVQMKEQLTSEQLLLINQWVDFYKKVSAPVLGKIKQEVNMEFIETTISEHIFNQGKIAGIAEGEARGEARGEVKGKAEGEAKGKAEGLMEGQLLMLENLCKLGLLSKAQKRSLTANLRPKRKKTKKNG